MTQQVMLDYLTYRWYGPIYAHIDDERDINIQTLLQNGLIIILNGAYELTDKGAAALKEATGNT